MNRIGPLWSPRHKPCVACLAENPNLATRVGDDGSTPLWWLPDDEGKAMQIAELLLEAGADPSTKNKEGRTAGDWARRRGMRDVAARLSG